MTRDQERALAYARHNFGEVTEGALWFEGLNRPRQTLSSLVKRGVLVRHEWLDEEWGYRYELARAAA